MFFKKPEYANASTFTISTFLVIGLFHLLSLLAFTTYTWEGLVLLLVISLATGSFGISFCYHRLLTHGSFKTNRFIKYLSTICAILALEGGPIFWVSTHRYHHKMSDRPTDPHSPRDGMVWAHMGWLMYEHPVLDTQQERGKIVSDLKQDPVICFLEAFNFPIVLLSLAILYIAGYLYQGPEMGLSFFIWGGVLRTVYVWHVTWLINSATHKFGYQNYETREDSTNHPLIALFSYGEGWHNNPHGDQRSACFWHRWFEFDLTYSLIFILEKVGLVHDVVKPSMKNPKVPPSQKLAPAAS